MRQKALPLIGLLCLPLLAACQSRDTLPERCYEVPSSGKCRAAFTRFYYDKDSGECRPFIWGGCDGNVPFETLEECTNTCNAPASDDASSGKQLMNPVSRPGGGY